MARTRVALAVLSLCTSACGPGRNIELSSATDESTGDATESTGDTEESSTSTTETGDGDAECILAIRIDLCCNQPYPATPDELGSDPCIVEWPIDWEALPDAVVSDCVDAQPDWCEVVDCTFASPASEVVEPDESGECEYVCPMDTHLAYLNAGCGEPPPVVECLGIPPPCADEYCSCEGETIYGCGQVSEPFAHMGPC
jgi:hypothetical protein